MIATMQPPSSRETTSSNAVKTFRILYADDMRELRDLAVITLGRDGHSVECVKDGQAALARISANPAAFDLLITDHHMPNMNGLELINQVRASAYRGKIIIFCSELSPDVNQAYVDLGVDEILYKPILPSELRRVLAKL
jgi:two-component system, chemotaxis family, chemotaxis protein CheY